SREQSLACRKAPVKAPRDARRRQGKATNHCDPGSCGGGKGSPRLSPRELSRTSAATAPMRLARYAATRPPPTKKRTVDPPSSVPQASPRVTPADRTPTQLRKPRAPPTSIQ